MNKKLTQEVRQQINANYETIKQLLLTPSNYEHPLKTDNVSIYISFVENALEQNYARIMHIYFFICFDHSMACTMYPFCHLKNSANQKLESTYHLSLWVMEGLEEYNKNNESES